ncbi:hypothetical protein C8F01DRAFT_1146811 [Mycena amicta]|nr:hypothetical protein C8F01DRAFT_1146811 [Mycena amicta]
MDRRMRCEDYRPRGSAVQLEWRNCWEKKLTHSSPSASPTNNYQSHTPTSACQAQSVYPIGWSRTGIGIEEGCRGIRTQDVLCLPTTSNQYRHCFLLSRLCARPGCICPRLRDRTLPMTFLRHNLQYPNTSLSPPNETLPALSVPGSPNALP